MSSAATASKGCAASGKRGFTLIEMMVAITVIGLLTTAIVVAWRVSASAYEKTDRALSEARHDTAVQQLIERQMAAMVPVRPWRRYGKAQVYFQGQADGVRFVSRYSLAHRSRAGLVLAEYVITGSEQQRSLRYRERALTSLEFLDSSLAEVPTGLIAQPLQYRPIAWESEAASLPGGAPEWIVLAEQCAACRFEYFIRQNLFEPGRWLNAWSAEADYLPQAVALHLDGNVGDEGAGAANDSGVAQAAVVGIISSNRRPVEVITAFQ